MGSRRLDFLSLMTALCIYMGTLSDEEFKQVFRTWLIQYLNKRTVHFIYFFGCTAWFAGSLFPN